MSTCYQSQNDLTINIVPDKIHNKKAHIVGIDISGSMGGSAIITDESGNKIPTEFSYLDLVKHCIKMYIHSINKSDLFTLIAFNSTAYPIIVNEEVNEANVNELCERVMKLKPSGSTNLWDCISLSYEIISQLDESLIKNIVILTDGVPNQNPPRGIIYSLSKYLKQYGVKHIPIHLLGFGYNLEIETLNNICSMTNGTYNFIPSSAEMLTVMVHLMSNINIKCNKNVKINVKYNNISNEEIKKITQYLIHTFQIIDKTVIIDIGQTTNITILMDSLQCHEPNITYSIETSEIKTNIIEIKQIDLPVYNEINKLRIIFIRKIMEMYNNATNDRFHKNEKIYKDLLEILDINNETIDLYVKDLTGEIKLALLNSENFIKWGKYYIPSLIGAYSRQECNSFRDYGIQTFCSEEFKLLRDKIDELCDELPALEPTIEQFNYQQCTVQASSVQPVRNIRQYQDLGGCIHPHCLIKTTNGFVPLGTIKMGDEIINTDNQRSIVECVVKHKCPNNHANLCKIGELYITPYHPVFIDNKWQFPINIEPSKDYQCDYVYNLILNNRKSINVNNIHCCTLGHGIEGEVIGHPFFGTEEVVYNLQNLCRDEYNEGLVKSTNIIQRDVDTGLICGYL
jgi:hypothetical protein